MPDDLPSFPVQVDELALEGFVNAAHANGNAKLRVVLVFDGRYTKEFYPEEGTPEHESLVDKHGFRFWTLLGELMYACVTC